SMIQVADGALQVIDEKLIRMKELATQAATGTYTADQRAIIDDEFQAMKAEIDRIANSTEFNGIKLLDGSAPQFLDEENHSQTNGSYAYWKFENNTGDSSGNEFNGVPHNITYGTGQDNNAAYFTGNGDSFVSVDSFSMQSTELTISSWIYLESPGTSAEQARQILSTSAGDSGMQLEIWGIDNRIMFDATSRAESRLLTPPNVVELNKWHFITATVNGNTSSIYVDNTLVAQRTVSGTVNLSNVGLTIGKDYPRTDQNWHGFIDEFQIRSNGVSQSWIQNSMSGGIQDSNIKEVDGSILIHFGPKNRRLEDYYPAKISKADSESLGINETAVETQKNAQESLTRITDAIVYKDKIRANLGATQNRLENTITNLQIQTENLQAAESRISDADVAQEMTAFVKE
ncbi:MAG: hypothetical protein EOL98_15755, partial [Negativicutes bacterium]|nr:hypothetical protein [Negativicutes bacterium]